LSTKYNGWQTIDATPQETSDGVYQCGPCPLSAIKNGEKNIKYDLEFIYSEVSADVNYWVQKDDGSGYDLVKVEHDTIGKLMSTKAVGNNNRHDITLEYKYPEGSVADTLSHNGASQGGDVKTAIEVKDGTKLGDPINIKVSAQRNQNIGNNPIHAVVQIVVTAVSYSGRRSPKSVKDIKGTINVPVDFNQASALTLTIKPEEYTPFLKEDVHFDIKAFINIQERNQYALLEKEFTFLDHPILLDYLGTLAGLKVGTRGKVKVTYSNPLNVPLTEGVLRVDGQGLTEVQTFKIGTIQPGQTFTQIVDIEATSPQNHFLIASLETKELTGIRGQVELLVLS